MMTLDEALASLGYRTLQAFCADHGFHCGSGTVRGPLRTAVLAAATPTPTPLQALTAAVADWLTNTKGRKMDLDDTLYEHGFDPDDLTDKVWKASKSHGEFADIARAALAA